MRDLSYGMYLVSSKKDKNVGCIINTLCQITSGDDPIITISLNKDNYTNQVIKNSKKFAVSILSEETPKEVIGTFGFSSSKEIDKFEKVEYEEVNSLPIVKEKSCGYVICDVIDIVDCNTHDIFIARVIDGDKKNEFVPMTYRYYHEVIKGKAPKKAPTYVEEKIEKKTTESGKEVWICTVCGYVHEGELPEEYKCPICGVERELFKRREEN